jgi:hypothetical protein
MDCRVEPDNDAADSSNRKKLPSHYGQQDLSADAAATLANV